MEIINVNDDRFVVVQKIDLEKFRTEEIRNKFFEGKLWLRQENSNIVYLVSRIVNATFEDILDDAKSQTNEPITFTEEQTNAYTGSVDNLTGQHIDIKG